jgi:hypothetical protein
MAAAADDNDAYEDAWAPLEAELDAWMASGRAASVWWRDDDAARPTAALDRLLGLAATAGAPLALAVVPAWLCADPSPALAERSGVAVLQHGFAHVNHAKAAGEKGACEIGLHRGRTAILDDLAVGRACLEQAFGNAFVPVLVPPWNRLDQALLPDIAGLGYRGVSTFGPRGPAVGPAGLVVNNCHCDAVDWKHDHAFRGTARTLVQLIGHLAARRAGEADPDEASGLLTHHLDMDEATWAFTARLLDTLARHPAVNWMNAREIFSP